MLRAAYDARVLIGLLDGDLASARGIAAGFVDLGARPVHDMTRAASALELEQLVYLAHDAKGMARTIGAERLADAAAAVEAHAAGGADALVLAALIDAVHREWLTVAAALRILVADAHS